MAQMRDSWIPTEEELTLIAATVPLLASMTVVKRTDGQIAAGWSHPDAFPIDALTLARLLPYASNAMGAGGAVELTVTVSSSTQSVVVTELGLPWIVVFGFREAVSYDWASYYVRRALGLMKRREG